MTFKRAYAKVDNKRVAITSNQVVEEALGKSGIICIEDLVHELYTSGDSFDIVNNFIWYNKHYILRYQYH